MLLKDLGCPCDPKDIGITASVLKDTFLVCKETRNRYTVFQLAWDLAVMDDIADEIIAELQSQNAI